jgi:hypothetical protein
MSTDTHTLAEQARHMGYRTSEQIINRLERFLIKNEAYLARHKARGTHTSHDDTLAEDCCVIGLCIQLLQEAT